MLAKKLWVKFDNFDIVCFCEENRKECPPESKPDCKEYIVKFIEIKRSKEAEENIDAIKDVTKRLEAQVKREKKKFETQLQRSLREMKKFKI